jgi:hypothetical protein
MKRTASEVIHNLEMRIARLERQGSVYKPFKLSNGVKRELEKYMHEDFGGEFFMPFFEYKTMVRKDDTFYAIFEIGFHDATARPKYAIVSKGVNRELGKNKKQTVEIYGLRDLRYARKALRQIWYGTLKLALLNNI